MRPAHEGETSAATERWSREKWSCGEEVDIGARWQARCEVHANVHGIWNRERRRNACTQPIGDLDVATPLIVLVDPYPGTHQRLAVA